MSRIRILLISLLSGLPIIASALGLGQIHLESGLNQPFEARIDLLSPTADELSTLKVGLADQDAFDRAGVERLFVLTNLRFEVKETENGPDYILITSKDPIREPYLNFLVEADWSKGRLYREYTVLLDPPLYDPNARKPVVSMPQVEQATTAPEQQVSTPSQTEQEVSTYSTGGETSGGGTVTTGTPGEYGPTVTGDTLWSIASSARPDDSISVQQMMMALLQANPNAFIDNNINGLKRGEILRIPNRNEILAMTQADALAEARAQNAAWQETRGTMAATTPTRPLSAAPAETTGEAQAAAPEESSELRLVAAGESGSGTEKGDTGAATSGESEKALALANEQLQTLTSENKDLKDRLAESESIINDLKRLVSLKDDELASLQNQQAATEEQVQPAEEAATTEAEETPTAPAAGEEEQAAEETPAETVVEEPARPAEETPAEPEKKPATKVVEETKPISAPKGMVGQIIDTVMQYKVYIGGGVGALLVIVIGFVFVSSRKKGKAAKAGEPETEVITRAPPYAAAAASEEETILPGEAVEEEGSEAATVLPEGASEAVEEEEAEAEGSAEDATVFAAPPGGEAEAAEPEEDPLAEVNVFLAYEHFDQAEEFVRDAITKDPDNLEFHTKLLEVFYASGDKAKYEEAAKVLHDKVDGQGPNWDMAVAMWSEMSPGRALFEEGAAEEEETSAAETTGGGVLDLTSGEAEESAADAGDMDLDFDLGDTTDVPPAASTEEEQGEDLLDVTAAVSMTDTGSDEDLLDVTAAVGLDSESASDEELLDLTSGGAEEPEEDLLDVSATSGDSLLDVTAQSDTESLSSEEDLLDVTAATSAGADSEELLEVSEEAEAPAEAEAEAEDNSLDFDIGGLEVPEAEEPAPEAEETMQLDVGDVEEEAGGDDNVIDFDSAASAPPEEEGEGLDLNLPEEAGEEEGLDFNLGLESEEEAGEEAADEGGIDLSIDDDSLYNDAETLDIKLEDSALDAVEEGAEAAADEGLDFDLDTGESGEAEIPSLEEEQDEGGVELDLTLDEAGAAGGGLELDVDAAEVADDEALEETVKIPEIDMDFSMEEEDDDDNTVFVPRSDSEEQSEEDEVATKLDLAKAYVELGDKDSAKGILEEIINEGNEQQKATAQELLKQVS